MKTKLFGLILVTLVIGTLFLPFNTPSLKAESKMPTDAAYVQNQQETNAEQQKELETKPKAPSNTKLPIKPDWLRRTRLKNLDFDNATSLELIIGVSASKSEITQLKNEILVAGGEVTGTISTGKAVRAITVNVPTEYAYVLTEKLAANKMVEYVEPNLKVKASMIPNDPSWSQQWGPQKIEADYAWNTTIGSSDILVAIVDTGIDYTHPELVSNYVPLGYDWVNIDADPMDDHGHGTHCAGIVAAKINNGIGIAGLAQVRIMAEKVLTSSGWGYYSWVAQGIYHATDAGAKVISMSLGGDAESDLVHDALEYAYAHGVLCVAAAGNDADDLMNYPAGYDECIAVTATDSSDNLAWFSTYGDWVDLAAPGVDIYSTLLGNSYASWSGTSMACPHVSGTAALVWSLCPSLSNFAVREILERTADDIGNLGFDIYFGHGRINARKAVLALPEHDISIWEWDYPHRIDPGAVGIFNVTISNYAQNNETNILVQFLVDGNLVDSRTIDFLRAGNSKTLNFTYSTTVTGFYNFTCYVVPVSGENVTENNIAISIVQVRFAGILRVPSEYATIKLALNNATVGDTVLVSEGTYAEGQIDITENGVALVADGHVVLDAQGNLFVVNINANDVVVEGFEMIQGIKFGAKLHGFNNTLTRNFIHGCTDGIWLYQSYYSALSLNNVTVKPLPPDCYPAIRRYGIFVDRSFNNTISQNRLKGGALWLFYCGDNLIVSNKIYDGVFGILVQISTNNVLRDNSMTNNTRNFGVWTRDYEKQWEWEIKYPWQAINDIDASNTVDGKPIYYWVYEHDKTVLSEAGCVVLVYCNNITVQNTNITKNLNGILLLATNNTKISKNTVKENTGLYYEDCSSGITVIFDSSNNIITENNVTSNDWDIYVSSGRNNNISMNRGIVFFVYSTNCILLRNTVNQLILNGKDNVVMFNTFTGDSDTLILEGTNQTISGNTFYARVWTLYITWLSYSVIASNNITSWGDRYPIVMVRGIDNFFVHNNVWENAKPVIYYEAVANQWDNGYPFGGNYWSDYNGVDEKSGPGQNLTGSDGIGDTPYTITSANIDHYPKMNLCTGHPAPQTQILPNSTTIILTQTVNFKSTTLGFYPPFSFQWYLNDTAVPSATGRNWNFTPEVEGHYLVYMKVTDFFGNTTKSNEVMITVKPVAVSISPTSASMYIGQFTNLTSTTIGAYLPFNYQWYLNDSAVSGATDPTWAFQTNTPGYYIVYLNVTDNQGNIAKSNNASVTVLPLTTSISPTSASLIIGQSTKFTSTIFGGYPPFSFQWYLNGSAVFGATNSSWTFTPDETGYYVVYLNLTDNLGNIAKSNQATIKVVFPILVSISPSSATVFVDQYVLFHSTTSGGFEPCKYLWFINGSYVMGAIAPVYTFRPSTPGYYIIHLRITDNVGNVALSNEATVIAIYPLEASISPTSVITNVGRTIEFTATTSGGRLPYSFQWYLNGSAVSGATNPSWTFIPDAIGRYIILLNVTDNLGNTALSNATITVTIPGDINGDFFVNIMDASLVGLYWLQTVPPAPPNIDINSDGIINILDATIIGLNWLQQP